MKICAIEIKSNKAIVVILEKDSNGNFKDNTGKFKSLTLENDENHLELLQFVETIHSQLQLINPDLIGIIRRSAKGKFSASSVSFKIEGLIQSYKNTPVEFFAPQSIRAFYKKNSMPFNPAHIYQLQAYELAYLMLNQ
jgi:hypothetical protein